MNDPALNLARVIPAMNAAAMSMRDFAAAVGRIASVVIPKIRSAFLDLVPRHQRKRYSPPTPWHMKRARVALRRQDDPIIGAASLARRYRIEGHTP